MAARYSDSVFGDSVFEILTAAGAGDISSHQFEPVDTAQQILRGKEAREGEESVVDDVAVSRVRVTSFAGGPPVDVAPSCGSFWDLDEWKS